MSIKAMARVWETSKHEGSTLLLLLAMADYANEYGLCWASIDALAKKARLSRRTVIDHCDKLLVSGEIRAEGASEWGTNRYQIMGGAEFAPPPEAIEVARETAPSPGGGANLAPVQIQSMNSHPIRKERKTPIPGTLKPKDLEGSGAKAAPPVALAAPQNLWVSVLGQLQAVFPKAEYKTWLEPTQVVSQVGGEIVVGTANQYAASWLESHAKSAAENEIIGLAGRPMSVRFVVLERVEAAR